MPKRLEVILMDLASESRCLFQIFIVGIRFQVRRLNKQPKWSGRCFLAFRQTRTSPVISLFTGATMGGAKVMIQAFRNRQYDPTALLLDAGHKSGWI